MQTARQIIARRLIKLGVSDPSLSHGIIGSAQITEPSAVEARRTALVLRSGSLPYTFKQVARTTCPR
jgi:preprotein translocase subunit SecD